MFFIYTKNKIYGRIKIAIDKLYFYLYNQKQLN